MKEAVIIFVCGLVSGLLIGLTVGMAVGHWPVSECRIALTETALIRDTCLGSLKKYERDERREGKR
jgi:hypothetical protein